MPLGLNPEQLGYYQQLFNLSYHLNYPEVRRQRIPLQSLDVLEVGGAMPASLVMDQLGFNSWIGVEAPSYDEELGETTSFTVIQVTMTINIAMGAAIAIST